MHILGILAAGAALALHNAFVNATPGPSHATWAVPVSFQARQTTASRVLAMEAGCGYDTKWWALE
jgi:hypothetical protein